MTVLDLVPMSVSEPYKWGLGPTAPAGSRGRAPGLLFRALGHQ